MTGKREQKASHSGSAYSNQGKLYSSPKVVNFGQVREITTGGSKGGKEGTAMSTDQMI